MEAEISRSPADVARKSVIGSGAQQRRQDPEEDTQNDDDQSRAERDPGPKTRLAGTLDGAGAIPHFNLSVDLRRVHDGDYTERQAAENRSQDGRYQVVGYRSLWPKLWRRGNVRCWRCDGLQCVAAVDAPRGILSVVGSTVGTVQIAPFGCGTRLSAPAF